MKKLLSTLILLISSALFYSTSFAQYEPSTQLGLPEGAIARFCKGFIKKIKYSPDGSQVAVITYRDVWIYDAKTGEELNLLTGHHTDRVFDATYSPDGKTLATVSFDKTVRLWDVDAEKNTRTLKGHTEQVYTVAYSPDGKTLTTGGYDKVMHLWDAHTGKKLRTLKGHTESLEFVGYALNGNVIVSAGSDRTVRLWDVDNGKLTNLLHPYETPIAISPNGETVIVTGSSADEIKSISIDHEPGNDTFLRADNGKDEVYIFNVATGKPVRTFNTDNHVDSMTYSADGKMIATVAEGGVKLWNVTTGKLIKTLIERDLGVGCIAFSPDGKTFATGCIDGTMRWWDLEAGSNVKTFTGFTYFSGDAIEFSPDGKNIAISNSNDISLWNVTTGKLLKTLEGHGRLLTGMTFSPDGKTIATSSTDGTARLWDVNTGSNKFVLVELADHTGSAVRIEKPVFSPDGKTIAASSKNYMLWLWDAHTGKNIKTLQGEGGNYARSFDFSPDSQLLATNQKDRSVLIMNARTGQHINILDRPGYDMVFSPDSKTLTTTFPNAALLWNPITGELIKHIHSPQAFMTTVLHLHNKPFAITSYKDETASLWDVTTGDHITKFKLPDNMNTVFRLLYPGAPSVIDYEITCSPTGKTFAMSDINKPVRLWDVAKGELIGIPIKHLKNEGGYAVLKYSPDGKTLATIPVGTDSYAGGTVRLWSASTGRHLKTLRGYSNCEFKSVAFSPDSKTIATGHKDGTVLLWDIPVP